MTVDVREAAERFARAWGAGWAAHDTAAIVPLYAVDCVHRSMPFREAHQGRAGVADYIAWAFSTERATEVRFSAPIVAGDLAILEYWATLVEHDDSPSTIAGCVMVRFGRDGLVSESRDYWHVTSGHRRPEGALFISGPAGPAAGS
jgi:ketosteroid isomerase-like protein